MHGTKVNRWTVRLGAGLVSSMLGCGPPPAVSEPQAGSPMPSEKAALDQACDEGDVEACFLAGQHHQGQAAPSEATLRRMARAYYRGCRGGHHGACVALAEAYVSGKVDAPQGRGFGRLHAHVCSTARPDDAAACLAAALLGRACGGGAADGCAALAGLIESGRLGPRPVAQVHGLLDHACAGGHAASCLDIGRRHRDGSGGAARDLGRAIPRLEAGCRLARPAGEQGPASAGAEACTDLADLVARGQGTEPDLARAAGLHATGCQGGVGRACTARGRAFQWGRGVAPDAGQALELWKQGCTLGDPAGCVAAGRATDARSAFRSRSSSMARSTSSLETTGTRSVSSSPSYSFRSMSGRIPIVTVKW